MSAFIADRDALEKALRTCRVEDGSPAPLFREGDISHIAHQLIATGAVIDVATLADDLRAMAEVWGGDSMWVTTGTKVANLMAETVIAALTERAQ